MSALELFHPLIRRWFRENLGSPTDIQERAWPVIAGGSHCLITAPTGSGKTLTAFLWALQRFCTEGVGEMAPGGGTVSDAAASGPPCGPSAGLSAQGRILYISPLKALNTDIGRNLTGPLEGLAALFAAEGETFKVPTIGIRSGDTEQAERQRMRRRPPDIFITTPESLNILLSSRNGQGLLNGFSTVILDEIHAVAEGKRGAYLMSGVERLLDYSGEFQRIALSATVRPLSRIARFTGGYRASGSGRSVSYVPREVEIVTSDTVKEYSLEITMPDAGSENPGVGVSRAAARDAWWHSLVEGYLRIIRENTSTLVFANSRRLVEKLSRLINERAESSLVYAHHGSLSKELRSVVEERLKAGELKGIVATSSLELGIDVGAVDAVVLAQSPQTVASTVQRIGRSGHRIDQVSRGVFLPIHGRDLLPAVVLADLVGRGNIEEVRPVKNPLDVLAQIILSTVQYDEKSPEEIYSSIRRCTSFHDLGREEFDLVVEMLAGRYAGSRMRELSPRIVWDRERNRIRTREKARHLLFLSGGVIPDRGYYALRIADTKAKIGELDEEFVWERSLGEAFPFGNGIWRILRITENDVEVVPAEKSNTVIPFWRADELNRSFFLSEALSRFLGDAEERLVRGGLTDYLVENRRMTPPAAEAVARFLTEQRAATGRIPSRTTVVAEHYRDPLNAAGLKQTVLHTLWGGKVNRPFAFALQAAWKREYGYTLELFANNDSILVNLPHDVDSRELFALVSPARVPELLRERLESTGFFGALFRENAQRSLLLPRRGFDRRTPLWLNRLKSKKLLQAVARYEDFPVVLETWKDCLTHAFDLETLTRLLEEIADGEIVCVDARTEKPSPLSEDIIWRQTNYYMYEDDTPASSLKTDLHRRLIEEVLKSSSLRPRFSDDLIDALDRKLKRTEPGYPPDTPEELLEWVKERLFIPAGEYEELLEAAAPGDREGLPGPVGEAIVEIRRKGGSASSGTEEGVSGYAARENREEIETLFSEPEASLAPFLERWIDFYGPITEADLARLLPVARERIGAAVEDLAESGKIIVDEFREGSDLVEICDAENLEILLRMRRRRERISMEPVPVEKLPYYLAFHQGVVFPGGDFEDFKHRMEPLFGYPLPAGLWEREVFPARMDYFRTEWTDSLLREHGLCWFGTGPRNIGFCFPEDLELFPVPDTGRARTGDGGGARSAPRRSESGDGGADGESALTPEEEEVVSFLREVPGKVEVNTVARSTGLSGASTFEALWGLAWKGMVSADDFVPVRKGVLGRFKIGPGDLPGQAGAASVSIPSDRLGRTTAAGMKDPDAAGSVGGPRGYRRSLRRRGERWRTGRIETGSWYALPASDAGDPDELEETERMKDRVRQLLARYGVLFREILKREMPALGWGALFRVLRLMELSGEIVTGRFFREVPGVQFAVPEAVRELQELTPFDRIYFVNGADPASACGIDIPELKSLLPERQRTTHQVFHDDRLLLVSKRNGRDLEMHLGPEDPRLPRCLDLFRTLLERPFQPLSSVTVEKIDSLAAAESPYSGIFREYGFSREYKNLRLWKSYR
jgi:ATP-dependent Lhr-like helicase